MHEREVWLVGLESETGLVGWGEAAPLAGFGGDAVDANPQAVELELEAAIARLVGTKLEPDGEAARLAAHTPAARAALGLALADLAAQGRGETLAAALARRTGGHARSRVVVNALLAPASPPELARRAREAVAAGFGTLKLKLRADALEAQRARVAAVRESVGPAVRLRLDPNASLTEEQAFELCRALGPLAPEYVEQPLAPSELEAMARLREASPIAIAADEAASSPEAARRVLETGAADVLILKPTLAGGPDAALEIAAAAAGAGVPLVVTSALESAIGRTAGLHVAAALGDPARAAGLVTGAWLGADVAPTPAPSSGVLALPKGAGLGVAPRREALERLAVAEPKRWEA